MSKTDSEKSVNRQRKDSLAKLTAETLKISTNESNSVPSSSSPTSSTTSCESTTTTKTVTINSSENNDADHSSYDGGDSSSESDFIELLNYDGEIQLCPMGPKKIDKTKKDIKMVNNKPPVPIQPKPTMQPQMVIVKPDPNNRYKAVSQTDGVVYLYPVTNTDNTDTSNQMTRLIDNMIPTTSTGNDPTLIIPQSPNKNNFTYIENNQQTQSSINQIKENLQSSIFNGNCTENIFQQTNVEFSYQLQNNNINNNGIMNLATNQFDESFHQLPTQINHSNMPNMNQAPLPQTTFYNEPIYNSNPVSPQTPRYSEPNVGMNYYGTPFSPPQDNNFNYMSGSERNMSASSISQLLNSPISSPSSDGQSINRSRQIIQINASPQMQAQLYTQICTLETAKIADLGCIVRLKKDYGNTFIHQLAALELILHNLSKQTVQVVLQYDNPNNQYARLPTQLFMLKIIERAIRDQKRPEKPMPMLLYDLLNTRNDNDETPLHIAVKYNRSDFVRLLLEHNALPNIQTKKGYTALHQACAVGAYDSFKVLMDYYYSKDGNSATINQFDYRGDTPLALAIINHSTEVEIANKQPYVIKSFKIIEELVERHANTRIKNHENNNLVHLLFQNVKCICEDRIRILNYLKVTKTELTEEHNIYGKNAWECWAGVVIYEKPEQLLQRLEGYQMQ